MLDVDGVLVNGRPADGKPWATDLKRDLGLDPKDLSQYFFKPFWQQIVTGQLPLQETLEQRLTQITTEVQAADLMNYWFGHDANIDQNLLAKCAEQRKNGIRIFLTTNQEHERADYLMNTLGLSRCVDGIIYSAKLGTKKPASDFFDAACKITESAAENDLLIDDTRQNISAARNAGWQALHWHGPHHANSNFLKYFRG